MLKTFFKLVPFDMVIAKIRKIQKAKNFNIDYSCDQYQVVASPKVKEITISTPCGVIGTGHVHRGTVTWTVDSLDPKEKRTIEQMENAIWEFLDHPHHVIERIK